MADHAPPLAPMCCGGKKHKGNANLQGNVVLPRQCHNLSGAHNCPPQETAVAPLRPEDAQAVAFHVHFNCERKKTTEDDRRR